MSTTMKNCGVRIHYGVSDDTHTACDKPWDHLAMGDEMHQGPGLPQFPYQRISWQSGDRREYVGRWPGPCPEIGCCLHRGHHGRCAF